MKSVILVLALGAGLAVGAAGAASADNSTNARSVDVLEEVVVTAARVNDSYVQRDGATGLKMDVDIRDVPASLQVISPQLIHDQAAGQTINAVLHDISGVSQTYGSGTGNLPAVSIRGFDTGGYTLVDGYPRSNGSTYDWSSIERLEVLKGPASLLYGMQYNIGGSINVVTRKPTTTRTASMELEAGSWRHARVSLDLGGPLGAAREVAYRFDFAVDTTGSFRDVLYEKNLYVAPSIRFPIGSADTLLLRADLHRKHYVPDPGLPGPGAAWAANALDYWYPGPARERMGFDLPISQYIGLPWWDSFEEVNRTLLIEWEHHFDKRWKLKTGVSPAWTNYSGKYSWFWWDQPTDDAGTVLPVVNHLFAGGYGYRTVETPLNVDLNGEFDIGRVNHKILFGYAYDYSRTRDSGPEQNTTLMPLEAVGSLDWLHGSHHTFVPDPDFPYGSWNYYQRTQGIYFQELMSLGKHWKLLAGYRYDRARGGWEYISGGDDITGNFQSSGGTPRMGAVYQPSSATSFYASWSRSFNPNWGRLVDGSLPPPERGLQTEIGLKQDFYDGKVNLNVAAYQLTKRNVERCAPQDPDCRLYVLAGEQESRGLEFDLNGELSRSLRVTAALTLQSGARVKKDLPPDTANTWGGALPIGTTFPGGPHVIANLFAVYSFREARFRGLELGCGLNYASASEQNLPNDGYRLPGERTLNLFGAWSLSPRLRAQLNVNNVTNRIAYSSAGWQGWPWLYFANTPTQAIFTLSVKL